MSEYIDIDQPLIFKDIRNRDVTGTIRRVLKANQTEFVLADVVPVVRCKDCKHSTRLVCDLAGNEGIVCRHGNIARRLDWFCADGEKGDERWTQIVCKCGGKRFIARDDIVVCAKCGARMDGEA